jgi:hypothetical protein
MKIALALCAAVVGTVAFTAPAAAASRAEGAWGAAQLVLDRVLRGDGPEAQYEGERKAYEFGQLLDLEEENTEETFRCRFARVINAEVQCISSTP